MSLLQGLMMTNYYCSYLETIVKNFNDLVSNFLDKLVPLADGQTTINMAGHVRDFTLDVVSKVRRAS